MNHDPFNWGRPSDEHYGAYNNAIANAPAYPKMNTQQPIVTGTSVISMKYDNGVIIPVGKNTVVGISGDISDMQHIEHLLEELETENNYDNSYADDEEALRPSNVFEYLAAVMYQRRSKMNPLWNALIVAGVEDKKPFLRYVNLLGVTYSSPTLATGFGAHLAIPLLRRVIDHESDIQKTNLETAEKTVVECMKILYYRDARSSRKYSLAIIDNDKGVIFKKGNEVENMTWGFAKDIRGYGTQTV